MGKGEIIRIMESIGLQKNEVFIYLDIISEGKSSENYLAKRTKIHRPNVYDLIERLIKKGVVTQSLEDNKKVFYPLKPKYLSKYIKQKEFDLEKIIPKIEEMRNKTSRDRKIVFSEGIQSIRISLDSLLNLKKPIFIFGIPKEASDILGGFINDFHKRRIKKKITMKHIYNKNAEKRIKYLNSLDFTRAAYLPTMFDSRMSTMICGDRVFLIFWEKPMNSIMIINKSMADSYRTYFEILWEETKLEY